MSKIFMGVRLRSLRQERGLTQAALAKALDLSSSYLNQIEQDQRPLTVPVLLKINKVLGVDIQLFSEDEEARVLTQLKDALSVLPPELAAVPMAELRAITSKLPHVAKAMLALHQRYVASTEQIELLAAHANGESVPLSDEAKTSGRALAAVPPQMPYEAVRDFFFARRNYFDALDCAAESLAAQAREHGDNVVEWLKQRLQASHALRVVPMDAARDKEELSYRYFEAKTRVLYIAQHLRPGQQAFHMATQLALLEFEQHIEQELQAADWQDVATQRLARIGLANYVAGAFLLPYRRFLAAAERVQYDVDVLARQFDVGFETDFLPCSVLKRQACRFSLYVSIGRAISANGSRPLIFTFPRQAEPAPCGWCMKLFSDRGRWCPSWPACPMDACISGLRAQSRHRVKGGGRPRRLFPSDWDAMCAMPIA